MKRELENRFYALLEDDNAIDCCVQMLKAKNGLFSMEMTSEEEDSDYSLHARRLSMYLEEFDDGIIYNGKFPEIFDEIESNLLEYNGEINARNKYVDYLIEPFRKLQEILNPNIADTTTADGKKQILEKELFLSVLSNNKISQKYWRLYKSQDFDNQKKYDLENCFTYLIATSKLFVQKLDMVLLLYGYDFLEIQKRLGFEFYTQQMRNSTQNNVVANIDKISLTRKDKKYNANLKKVIDSGVLDKTIKIGLAESDGENYKWRSTKALLAYFAETATKELQLICKENGTCLKLFEDLFNEKNLKDAKAGYKNGYGAPEGSDSIEDLFK